MPAFTPRTVGRSYTDAEWRSCTADKAQKAPRLSQRAPSGAPSKAIGSTSPLAAVETASPQSKHQDLQPSSG